MTHNWSNIFTTCSPALEFYKQLDIETEERRGPADVTDCDHCDQAGGENGGLIPALSATTTQGRGRGDNIPGQGREKKHN